MWSLLFVLLAGTVSEVSSSSASADAKFSRTRNLPAQPSTRSSELGPLRLKFINKDGLPLDEILEGVSSYFYHAVSVKSLLVPIEVSDCNGNSIYESDVDMVIIVQATSDYNGIGLTGHTCANEENLMQNPIAGYILVYESLSLSTEEYFAVIFASTLRVLGIDYNQLPLWKKNQFGEVYDINPIYTSDQGSYLVTPKVIERLSIEFGTSNLVGLKISTISSEATGLMWDMKVLRGDVLSSIFFKESYISTVSLAALEDSGWYTVDYTMGSAPFYGRGKGDEYFASTCTEVETTDGEEWCTAPGTTCTYLRLKSAYCFDQNYYDNFFISDHCAIPVEYMGNCRYSDSSSNTNEEVFGLNSRCFMSSLSPSGNDPLTGSLPVCYEVLSCLDTAVLVKIGSATVECPFTGGDIQVEGFSGSVNCPNSNILCQDVPCLNFCSGHGKCDHGICQCFDGWYGDSCELRCSSNCVRCLRSGKCSLCVEGYFEQNGQCLQCSAPCLTCTSEAVCQTCNDGYYLDGESCLNCYSGCKLCTASNVCSDCKLGFNLNDNYCCPSKCQSCTHDSCSTCKDGFYLELGNCVDCPLSCSSCSGNDCVGCVQRFWLSGRSCSSCPGNCLECVSSAVCTLCDDGYLITSLGVCNTCPDVCSGCSRNVCTGCIEGYYLNGAICCPNSCETCNLEVCWTCKPGYLYKDGRCDVCPDSCTSCLNGVCVGCKDGFYLSGPICDPCINNCQTCSSSSYCYTCLDNFFLQDNGQCVNCPSVCNSCHNSVCFDCIVGYSKNQNICCPTGCDTCNLNVCWTCKDNYYFSNNNCIDCPSSCTSCKNGVCQGCIKGYYISGTSCSNCPSQCSACYSATSCSECNLNYFLSGSSCLACPSYCTTCQGTTCYSCATGYKLDGKQCKLFNGGSESEGNSQCGGNCASCEGGLCKQCKEGFFISSSKCSPCASNCNKCTGVWDCRECKSEYEMAYGVCCPKSCSSCSTTACYTCKPDYFLSAGNCVSCPSSCNKCLNGVCTQCNKGFYISGTSCSVCPTGCASCSSLTWCDSCYGGYSLKSGKCL